jgi:hypothetical protein
LTDEVIALVNEKFVPFAPRFGQPSNRYPWWKELSRVKNRPKGVGIDDAVIPGSPFWVATSAGYRVGAANRCQRAVPGKQVLAANLKVFLQDYAMLPKSERRPAQSIEDANLSEPPPPPGGLVLISYDRPLLRDGKGRYLSLAGPNSSSKNLFQHIPWQPGAQLDAFWLTKEECLSLIPKNPQKGQTISVPPGLTKRIGYFGLTIRSAWQEGYQWRPGSFQHGDLKVTVESVSPKAVQLRLHGSILMTSKVRYWDGMDKTALNDDLQNRYDAGLEGQLVYDPVQKRFTRWDMIVLGDFVGASLANNWMGPNKKDRDIAKRPLPIATSFEIDWNNYEVPPEYRRTTPHMLWWLADQAGNRDYYFHPDKWEENWKKRNLKQASK